MDPASSLSGSPSPAPLQPISPERVNQQRGDASGHFRDSSVHDKISQFNLLNHNPIALQKRDLERKANDAALRRAMLGREEAENEMRRCRDEAAKLRKQVDEGRDRERRVGERLETVLENYGRAKETHAHTQALWEKEIRRARKETFKSQSVIVKLQEEMKSARASQKLAEENLEREKDRSRAREQEAFQARYELVGCQGRLEQALEQVKVLEQERDAFKSLAKSEEDVEKIAAEGRLPLPKSEAKADEDEFASPRKKPRVSSLAVADVRSSAASEAELDELTLLWQWERQRADRASDHVEYLEAECQLRACSCMRKRPRSGTGDSARKRPALDLADGGDMMILSEKASKSTAITVKANISPSKLDLSAQRPKEEPRRSTIFIPEEGVFRTVSQEVAEAAEAAAIAEAATVVEATTAAEATTVPAADDSGTELPTPVDPNPNPPFYARTPSVDPPSFALLAQERTSLLSLLEAPHQITEAPMKFNIPTTPGPAAPHQADAAEAQEVEMKEVQEATVITIQQQMELQQDDASEEPIVCPHTSAAMYSIKTTTTKVPLRQETTDPSLAQRIMASQRTPQQGSRNQGGPTFDANNPALTPTMTREQALAQIRERRGRARSATGGAVTPRKQMLEGVERRGVSAPVARAAGPVAASVRRVKT